jgi:hypothetical protein
VQRLLFCKKYYTPTGSCQGVDILIIRGKRFKIQWFTDCGEWFIYVTLGRKFYRFSGAGFLKGKTK